MGIMTIEVFNNLIRILNFNLRAGDYHSAVDTCYQIDEIIHEIFEHKDQDGTVTIARPQKRRLPRRGNQKTKSSMRESS